MRRPASTSRLGSRAWRPRGPGAAARLGAVALLAGCLGVARTDAHKVITSKFTYSRDVFPILKERCARCHSPGGPTPMSLVTYEDALPWAESIREQLVAESMPPWPVDPDGPAVRGGLSLSAKELDTLVTWATGGTPRGDEPTNAAAPAPAFGSWSGGAPDAIIAMPAAHTLRAGTSEDDKEFLLPTGFTQPRWVRAIDLLPGDASMVRNAVVTLENGRVIAAWVPGQELIAAPDGTGFLIPAGARLRLRIHYKKNWQDDQLEKSDRSRLGVYFAAASAPKALQELAADVSLAAGGEGLRGAGTTMARGGRIVALRPVIEQPYRSLSVDALLPSGQRTPLLRLHAAQPRWYRRYWLANPIDLPQGAKLEVSATPIREADSPSSPSPHQLRLALDYVQQ